MTVLCMHCGKPIFRSYKDGGHTDDCLAAAASYLLEHWDQIYGVDGYTTNEYDYDEEC